MTGGELIIDSATGVDVRLRVAGPGGRAYAFLIDWHIRVILAVGWYAAAAMIYNGRFSLRTPDGMDSSWLGAVVAPPICIYLLYHVVLEPLMRGRSPGKRFARIRIVTRSGGRAPGAALLVRNIFRLIDSLPLFYTIGFVMTLITQRRQRIGDYAAGTLLVYETLAATDPAAVDDTTASSEAAEIASELLQRWERLRPQARRELAWQLLARQRRSGAPTAEVLPASADDGALRVAVEHLLHGARS